MQNRTKSAKNIKEILHEKLFDKLLFIILIINFERSISQTSARKKKNIKNILKF